MRNPGKLLLEPAHELGDRRINHKSVEYIDVIGDEKACARAIKAGRVPDFEADARKTEYVAKEPPLRAVVLSRIDKDRKQDQKRANDEEVDRADDPQEYAAKNDIDFFHLQ